ncbi:MAG: hypothetical protein JJD92_13910 [Frankiaceae bacterium]|nr:hypothetical protein [Frankiaceae bacterium]
MADIDSVLERLITDTAFRSQLSTDPAAALSGYDLTTEDLQVLASSMDDSAGEQHGVEQRTSKSAVVGLLASLTGGGGGSAGHKPITGKSDDLLAANCGEKIGGDNASQLFAPPQDAMSKDAMKLGVVGEDLAAPSDDATEAVHKLPGKPKPGEITLTRASSSGGGGSAAHEDFAPPVDVPGSASGDGSPAVFSEWTEKTGDGAQGNLAPADVNGDLPAIGDIKGAPVNDLSAVQGNFSPSKSDAQANDFHFSPKQTEAQANVLSPADADAAVEKIEIGAMKAGDTGVEVNGDGAPAELIGMLQPSAGDNAKGVDVSHMKAGDTSADFLTIEDG